MTSNKVHHPLVAWFYVLLAAAYEAQGAAEHRTEPLAAIARAGFVIEQRREFRFMPSRLAAPTSPMLLGRARKP